MKGKCNCGKKATTEWINHTPATKRRSGWAYSIKFCDDCRPKYETEFFHIIDGK